ncbi:unnamed protein product [Danaus chrysippus]|uniref:(African queen) hypothetical protein n=1 Tax=Danaus chrysippus TaxID=151541 RepID=A0A8J2R097_9NEOP|nr:unnamed protein product [Danaus chrysippus]
MSSVRQVAERGWRPSGQINSLGSLRCVAGAEQESPPVPRITVISLDLRPPTHNKLTFVFDQQHNLSTTWMERFSLFRFTLLVPFIPMGTITLRIP